MKKNVLLIGLINFLLILSIIGNVYFYNYKERSELYKRIILIDESDRTNMDRGNEYYEEQKLMYERGDYDLAILKCENAREYWSKYTQDLRETKEKISNYKEDIFGIYIQLIESEIKIYNNMYEACEYFESASRKYKYYYQIDVPANDMSFYEGNDYIEMGNEKIKAHDLEVGNYNTLLARYQLKLKEIIE